MKVGTSHGLHPIRRALVTTWFLDNPTLLQFHLLIFNGGLHGGLVVPQTAKDHHRMILNASMLLEV